MKLDLRNWPTGTTLKNVLVLNGETPLRNVVAFDTETGTVEYLATDPQGHILLTGELHQSLQGRFGDYRGLATETKRTADLRIYVRVTTQDELDTLAR